MNSKAIEYIRNVSDPFARQIEKAIEENTKTRIILDGIGNMTEFTINIKYVEADEKEGAIRLCESERNKFGFNKNTWGIEQKAPSYFVIKNKAAEEYMMEVIFIGKEDGDIVEGEAG